VANVVGGTSAVVGAPGQTRPGRKIVLDHAPDVVDASIDRARIVVVARLALAGADAAGAKRLLFAHVRGRAAGAVRLVHFGTRAIHVAHAQVARIVFVRTIFAQPRDADARPTFVVDGAAVAIVARSIVLFLRVNAALRLVADAVGAWIRVASHRIAHALSVEAPVHHGAGVSVAAAGAVGFLARAARVQNDVAKGIVAVGGSAVEVVDAAAFAVVVAAKVRDAPVRGAKVITGTVPVVDAWLEKNQHQQDQDDHRKKA